MGGEKDDDLAKTWVVPEPGWHLGTKVGHRAGTSGAKFSSSPDYLGGRGQVF